MRDSTKYLSLLTLAYLAVLAFYSTPTMACRCMQNHPQNSFCSADYVVVVRVVSTSIQGQSRLYKVKIKKTYKMTPKGKKTLKKSRLLTSLQSAACGVSLTVGKWYVIAGQGPQLYSCNYIKGYNKTGSNEMKAYSGVHRKACKCEVEICYGNSCNENATSATGCKWSSSAKCATKLKVCKPSLLDTMAENPISHCQWTESPLYKKCMSNL